LFPGLAPRIPVVHAPDGNSREQLVNIFIPPLTKAPFTATVTAEWLRTLEDGTTVSLQNRRSVMRDSAGRIFQERRSLVPKSGPQEPELLRVEISDPATHRKYFCFMRRKVCDLEDYYAPAAEPLPAAGPREDGEGTVTREDLGKNTVSGLEAIGTLETTIINAGAMGNDRPISITKEFWYSPQLGLNLYVKRVDPRHGTQTFTVSEIGLAEPDPSNFSLPAGFAVADHRAEKHVAIKGSSPQN
jgi:hypothetical protein